MKKICSLNRGGFMLLLFLLYARNCDAQKKASSEAYPQVAGQVTFIVHAPVVLPALLERKQYDTMGYYLQNWKNSQYPNMEYIFAMQLLLAIQSDKYNLFPLPFDCMNYLSAYAKQQNAMLTKEAAFRYYIKLDSRYSYDATEAARGTLLFIRSWSKQLIKTHKLTTSQLFICRTLSGDITAPREEFASDPDICPDLARVQEQIQACKNRYFIDERSHSTITLAFLAGGWFPTHNLHQVLGPHPSIGFSVGWRNRLNECDLVFSYRYIHTTTRPYDYWRQDSLYTSNHYEGAFYGIDYTRYLVHTTRTDMGLVTGIGYEYFNVPRSDPDQSDDPDKAPDHIGSFNWNVGVRYKYFIRRRWNLGWVARYNVLHYKNTGGTNLNGNAFSLDFTVSIN